MKTLDMAPWNYGKYILNIRKTQRWILIFLLMAGFWTGAAQADVSINSITQSPANNVPLDTLITYRVNYTSTGGSNEQVRTVITENGVEVTGQFQVTSSNCFIETNVYCNPLATTDTYSVTWTPSTSGTHNLNFSMDCANNPNCIGSSQSIITIVGSSDLPPQPPIANAGPDQSVSDTNNDGSETVILDGSSSSDPNGDIVSYEWLIGETLIGTGATTSLQLNVGTHTITLAVTDSMQNTSYDNVTISIRASSVSPVANAGPDQTVTDSNGDGVETVTLDASGSTISQSTVIVYEWYEGNTYLGFGESLAVVLPVGAHTLTLQMVDSEPVSTDEVIITVLEPSVSSSESPTIETLSGENQKLSIGESSDPLSIRALGADGQPLQGATITWTILPTNAATVSNTTTTTDANGETSNIVTPYNLNVFKVVASLPGGQSARFTINPLAGISGLTPAQRSVANALDNACPTLQQLINNQEGGTTQQESLSDTCDYLATASDQEIISALNQFVPDEIAAQGKNSISYARIRNRNILLRLDALRHGFTGPSIENLSVSIQGEQLPSILISQLSGLQRGGAASADTSNLASPLGIFVNGNISLGDTETTAREAGFDFSTNGLTLGVDYRLTNEFVFGGAFNYLTTDSDYISKSSNLNIDGYSLSLYGTYYRSEQIFVDSILSIGLNSYDTKREFSTGGVAHNLAGDTDGTEYALSLGAGYELNNQNLTFVPQVRINYLHVEVEGYDETSSNSGLNMSIDNQDLESLIATVSGSVSVAYSTEYGVFMPYFLFEWEHEYKNDSRAIVARFVNDPGHTDFSVLTDNPDRDYFNLGLGVTAALQNGKSAFLYYEKMLGHEDTSQYTITGGFRLEF